MSHNAQLCLVAVVRGFLRTKRATKNNLTLCEGMIGAPRAVVASAGTANTQGAALATTARGVTTAFIELVDETRIWKERAGGAIAGFCALRLFLPQTPE